MSKIIVGDKMYFIKFDMNKQDLFSNNYTINEEENK